MPRVIKAGKVVDASTKGRIACHMKDCRRRVLWKVKDRFFCNPCFDKWTEDNWDKFEPETIERLSDCERDFEFVAMRSPQPLCQVPRLKEA